MLILKLPPQILTKKFVELTLTHNWSIRNEKGYLSVSETSTHVIRDLMYHSEKGNQGFQ